MQITLIAAMANQQVIGYQNELPWNMPADMQHFKKLTFNKPIIMGRKTFESMGKALPNRTNIIITRNKNYQAANCCVVDSLVNAIAAAGEAAEIMIIGGAEIYQQALSIANRMYLTFIAADISGDTYFPVWDAKQWQEIERQDYPADAKHSYPYSFVTLERLN